MGKEIALGVVPDLNALAERKSTVAISRSQEVES
jgi:hypothetical protein